MGAEQISVSKSRGAMRQGVGQEAQIARLMWCQHFVIADEKRGKLLMIMLSCDLLNIPTYHSCDPQTHARAANPVLLATHNAIVLPG